MKVCRVVLAILAVGLGFGCPQGPRSSPSRPDLETLRAALAERNELERTYLLASFLRTLGPDDVRPVLAEVEIYRAGIDADEVRLLMFAWARFDGPGAFATARDWPTPWKSILMEEAMHAWGFFDGPAALAESGKIEDEELREKLHAALMSGWVGGRNPLGAAAYAATLPDPRRRSRLAFRLAGEAKRDGPEALIAFADSVPEDAPNGFKATVFGHAAGMLARLDPERVAAWYERQMQQPYTSTALRSIASKWAQYHDPRALIAWIEALPLEEARETERTDAVGAAFRVWAVQDPEAAEAWLTSAPAGASRDAAIDEFMRAIAEASPADALRWSGLIQDEELRRKRTLRYTRKWFVADPDAASDWLARADIPPAWRQQAVMNLPHANRHGNATSAESVE
jgi:hypothetical protein